MKPNEAYNTISAKNALTLRDGTGTPQPLAPVRVYRYLGLTADWNTPVHHNERWRRVVNAQRAKTMRYMGVLLTARRRWPCIAPRTLAIAYTSYIRPQFEAGAELWGPMLTASQTRTIDGVQDLYLRQCLTPYNTPNSVNPIPAAFAEREFALMRPGIRIDKLALRLFHRLSTAPDGSALHIVHHTRWMQARAAAAAPATTNFGTAARQSWQYAMREVFKRNGLEAYWTGALPLPHEREKWYDRVDRAVRERWVEDLNARLDAHDGTKHVRLNAKHVTAPQYLSVATRNVKGRALLALLRCNALPIGHTAARYLAKRRSAHIPPSHVVTPPDRTVTQADVTRTAYCPDCITPHDGAPDGRRVVDGRVHFMSECHPQLFRECVQAVARKLHTALHEHSTQPDTCPYAARDDARFDDYTCALHECHAARVAHRWTVMPVTAQVDALTRGWAPKLLDGTNLAGAKSKGVLNRHLSRAFFSGAYVLLSRLWRHRTAVLGAEPFFANVPHLGMQVMLQPKGAQKPQLLGDILPPFDSPPCLSESALRLLHTRSLYDRTHAPDSASHGPAPVSVAEHQTVYQI
jgi:hypothetical protein